METFVIHLKDQAQQKALQSFLEGFDIPYEDEPYLSKRENEKIIITQMRDHY